jgi:hypothetical protein
MLARYYCRGSAGVTANGLSTPLFQSLFVIALAESVWDRVRTLSTHVTSPRRTKCQDWAT